MKRCVMVLLLMLPCVAMPADEIELLTGTKFQGELIEETDAQFRFKVVAGQTSAEFKFARDKVHALTVDGNRRIINERVEREPAARPEPKPDPTATGREPKPDPASLGTRTKAEVQKLIAEAGRTQPEWWNGAPEDYPKNLETGNLQEVGRYVRNTANRDPAKWKGAALLVTRFHENHKGDAAIADQAKSLLGYVHAILLRDYARGAWWLSERKTPDLQDKIKLAYCYAKLGNKALARGEADDLSRYVTRTGSIARIYILTGDTSKALAKAEKVAERWPDAGHFVAGDACRTAGRLKDAERYYEKALETVGGNQRMRTRIQANLDAVKAAGKIDLKKTPDGTYRASSPGYVGPVEVEVTVKDGRIEKAEVVNHRESWPTSAIFEVPELIVREQGIEGVDGVTGATLTSEAIINAAAKALADAAR